MTNNNAKQRCNELDKSTTANKGTLENSCVLLGFFSLEAAIDELGYLALFRNQPATVLCPTTNTSAICNHDVPTYRPTASEFQDFTTFVNQGYDDHSHHCGAMRYTKTSEGVYLDIGKRITPVKVNQFVGRNTKTSLDKTGFARYDDDNFFLKDMFAKFEDNLNEGYFSQYIVDKNATLFSDAEHPCSLLMFRSTFTPYLKDAAEEMFGINWNSVVSWFDHKAYIVMPQVLRANNIPFHCIQQRPGD
ncbi:hypothetical protein DAPPUDRAFT_331487 [Daphnia pulex]|uniref:Uncharacterized protein n=1 Tax=Daphnia pulex TaxID=6669 RepID=E9HMM4_DAPPU|nr:hypothetical protein DAPPUDRAFT_331487 [Daphnia pulex]|eukprot:EFX66992.1 hypothetical protein DAPPUDRAFT_331487 [Daphnia pulex]